MPTLTPTKQTGSTAKGTELVYVEPAQTVTDDDLAGQVQVAGMNAAFLADFLSACLTHERCGVHLYRVAAGRTNNPVLKRQYERFGQQTLRHVEILERVIEATGGNPSYVSPLARAVEGSDSKLLEATYAGSGSLDPMAEEMAMLDAVFMAETVDHANWEALGQLAQAMPEGAARKALQEAVDEVEPEEDEHHGWAKETRAKLTMLQASSTIGTKAMGKVEGLMAQVKGWLRGGNGSRPKGNGAEGKPRAAAASSSKAPASAKKAPAKKAAATKKTATKKAATKKAATKKAATKKKTAAKKAPAKRKTAAKKAPAKRKTAATKAPARRASTKKAAATRKKAPAKRTPARRR